MSSSDLPSVSSDTFRFKDLPPELRNNVYKHYFGCRKCRIRMSDAVQFFMPTALFAVDKAISKEALSFFYATRSFHYSIPRQHNTRDKFCSEIFRLHMPMMRRVGVSYVTRVIFSPDATYTAKKRVDRAISVFVYDLVRRAPLLHSLTLTIFVTGDRDFIGEDFLYSYMIDDGPAMKALRSLYSRLQQFTIVGPGHDPALRSIQSYFTKHADWGTKTGSEGLVIASSGDAYHLTDLPLTNHNPVIFVWIVRSLKARAKGSDREKDANYDGASISDEDDDDVVRVWNMRRKSSDDTSGVGIRIMPRRNMGNENGQALLEGGM